MVKRRQASSEIKNKLLKLDWSDEFSIRNTPVHHIIASSIVGENSRLVPINGGAEAWNSRIFTRPDIFFPQINSGYIKFCRTHCCGENGKGRIMIASVQSNEFIKMTRISIYLCDDVHTMMLLMMLLFGMIKDIQKIHHFVSLTLSPSLSLSRLFSLWWPCIQLWVSRPSRNAISKLKCILTNSFFFCLYQLLSLCLQKCLETFSVLQQTHKIKATVREALQN